jgi:Flp pilus assembly protein TadD
MLAVIVLTCAGGGGPDTAGYLLPLIPLLTLSAVVALAFLRIPKLPTFLGWSVALLLLVVPNLPALDRSRDDSAVSYQAALAGNTRGRLLFTDSTPDWFLLLEHSYQFQQTPNVIFTPYLHFPWYRASLDSALMARLPSQRDPPYYLIERAAGDLGFEPAYSFSSLPSGALGRLSPDGWLFRTEPHHRMKDSVELGRWKPVCHFGSPGARHRALRLAQGGQLLMAQSAFPEAVLRFTRALQCDPSNAGIWTALADAESRIGHDRTAMTSAKIALSLASGDHAILQSCTGTISRLSSGSLGSQAAATLCSLSSANPRSSELAAKAVRASLLAQQPSHGLHCLNAYAGPKTAELTNLEGTALLLQGHLLDAEASFRKALDLASTEPELQKRIVGNLVLCLQQLGESEEAVRVSETWRRSHNGTQK